MASLSAFDKRLCNALQIGLPLDERPFSIIARNLKSTENQVIRRTRALLKNHVIRRLGVTINWRAIGKVSTLVTAHIEQKDLKKVISAVNKLQGVSHNYLRDHYYNLWFTLRADSQKEMDSTLKKISKQFGIEFHSLPVERTFKLDARFDATSDGKKLLQENRKQNFNNVKTINLNQADLMILKKLQKGLKPVQKPSSDLDISKINNMIESGVISRIGAVVNHNIIGFTANAMLACNVNKSRIETTGKKLASLQNVSHCYKRRPFNGFPFNLFAMMHGSSMTKINSQINSFVRTHKISSFVVLFTLKTLKKN